MAEAVALALQTLALKAPSCPHCGKEGVELKRCSVCHHVSYCGAACQSADWKKHKKTCVTLQEVRKRVDAANAAADWQGLLRWEERMEQLLQGGSDDYRCSILQTFRWAQVAANDATGNNDHALAAVRLQDRRIELLGNMERFRDQGEVMCDAAEDLVNAHKPEEGYLYFQRARAVGAAHGFFSVECTACCGLGRLAMLWGRHEEGVELLRNALVASSLRENESDEKELVVLRHLTTALFQTCHIDEVEPLVLRFREAAKAELRREGGNCCYYWELESIYASAQLHEARGKPQEAEREVRALLDLLRENEAALQDNLTQLGNLLDHAITHLEILDPELGEEELVTSVAAERAKVTALMAQNSQRQ